jgi:2-isopropylmalate synthase
MVGEVINKASEMIVNRFKRWQSFPSPVTFLSDYLEIYKLVLNIEQPMDGDINFRFFQALVKIGYKEIEVSYHCYSQSNFDFTRRLIKNSNVIPDYIWIQVMAPCREQFTRQAVSVVLGAQKVILHIYLATTKCFRRVGFNVTEEETLDLAVRSTKLVRKPTRDSQDPVT